MEGGKGVRAEGKRERLFGAQCTNDEGGRGNGVKGGKERKQREERVTK